jgi:hypothetical protein
MRSPPRASVGAAKAPIGMQLRLAASLVDAGPLYAGECIERIDDIRPAGELVRELASGRSRAG